MDYIDKFILVRTYSAGVHYGTLKSRDGQEVVLSNARRLWFWEGAFTLNAVAENGVSGKSRISVVVPEILLMQAIEIIPISSKAQKILEKIPAHKE